MRRILACLAMAVLVLAPWFGVAAHDIPSDVTIQAFVKPAGHTLELLVRVPLGAMRDIDFPRRGPGYLDIAHADRSLDDAATEWIAGEIELFENDRPLTESRVRSVRVSLPSDRSFTTYEAARAHLLGPPLPNDTDLYWNQGMLDVLLEYPIQSDQSRFSIHPNVERLGLRVVTALRFLPPGGAVRAFEFSGDPGLVRLDPEWHQAAWRFVKMGFLHILSGSDHLLFLLCLVIPLRRIGPLVAVVTSFTVAHSITLIASAYNMAPDALWFPPLIEVLIAISIVYMALENIVVGDSVKRRWMMAFGFGLVHGFGFSFALRQALQFAGSHLLTSLLSFNVGVELGQLLVLAVAVPILNVLFRFVVAERMGTIILSALVAHTAWHWMIDRALRLGQFPWPALNAALVVTLMRALMWMVIFAGALWLASKIFAAQDRPTLAPARPSADLPGTGADGIEATGKIELETTGQVPSR
ncbi:MAG TPA: HupE/UreJ family protein [Candidatus Acidoferrales bacterium]|nr:HupE/UreJ family protein [Candidatus Acidoferrales bacterium]